MKKAISIIIMILLFFIIYFLQSNFFTWFNIAGIMPNMFVMLILLISLFAGRKPGIILGICFGLFIDITTRNVIGITAIIYGLMAFLLKFFEKNISKDSKITLMLITAGATAFCEILSYIYSIIRLGTYVDIFGFVKILLIEIIFNILITIILYPLIQKVGEKLEEIFKESSILTRYY